MVYRAVIFQWCFDMNQELTKDDHMGTIIIAQFAVLCGLIIQGRDWQRMNHWLDCGRFNRVHMVWKLLCWCIPSRIVDIVGVQVLSVISQTRVMRETEMVQCRAGVCKETKRVDGSQRLNRRMSAKNCKRKNKTFSKKCEIRNNVIC